MSTTETLTIHLPVSAARRLRRVAEIARRPVDEVLADTLYATLPPLLKMSQLHFRLTWHIWKPCRVRRSTNGCGLSWSGKLHVF